MKHYALGLDYGTLSVRALLLDLQTGAEAATAEYVYPHGIMTQCLPDGTPLPEGFALEHPVDFMAGLEAVIAGVLEKGQVDGSQVAGIGLDVTSPTVLPVDAQGMPLCCKPEFASHPHAWMKLWKHHGAEEISRRLLEVAQRRKERWLTEGGGILGSEWFICKATELAVNDPEVFANTYSFLEAADWLVWQLTGNHVRSFTIAGCTGSYLESRGYPSKAFFRAAYPQAQSVPDKLQGTFLRLGQTAGGLLPEMAKRLGLQPQTPVGIGTLDSHAGVIGCGASKVAEAVIVVGTSGCTMVNANYIGGIPGIFGAAQDANIPGLYGYEGSQNCVGDMLSWYVENCVPYSYYLAAQQEKKTIHQYLMKKAEKLQPGQSGVVALDWFNGVRTPYMDTSLTATISGLTIRTKPEEIYRALLEAAAFGQRRILELLMQGGCPVERIIAGGGIPGKNPLMMQIYADVCKRPICLSVSKNASALGSAILGACAAGQSHTGCKRIPELIDKYIRSSDTVYLPDPDRGRIYDALYAQYLRLADQTAAHRERDSYG